jgi:hypothetical protein
MVIKIWSIDVHMYHLEWRLANIVMSKNPEKGRVLRNLGLLKYCSISD